MSNGLKVSLRQSIRVDNNLYNNKLFSIANIDNSTVLASWTNTNNNDNYVYNAEVNLNTNVITQRYLVNPSDNADRKSSSVGRYANNKYITFYYQAHSRSKANDWHVYAGSYQLGGISKDTDDVSSNHDAPEDRISLANLSNNRFFISWIGENSKLYSQIVSVSSSDDLYKGDQDKIRDISSSILIEDVSVSNIDLGRVAVTWLETSASVSQVRLQTYRVTGDIIDNPSVLVTVNGPNTVCRYRDSKIAYVANKILVTWTSYCGTQIIHGQYLDRDLNKQGSVFQINEANETLPLSSNIIVTRNSEFLVSWQSTVNSICSLNVKVLDPSSLSNSQRVTFLSDINYAQNSYAIDLYGNNGFVVFYKTSATNPFLYVNWYTYTKDVTESLSASNSGSSTEEISSSMSNTNSISQSISETQSQTLSTSGTLSNTVSASTSLSSTNTQTVTNSDSQTLSTSGTLSNTVSASTSLSADTQTISTSESLTAGTATQTISASESLTAGTATQTISASGSLTAGTTTQTISTSGSLTAGTTTQTISTSGSLTAGTTTQTISTSESLTAGTTTQTISTSGSLTAGTATQTVTMSDSQSESLSGSVSSTSSQSLTQTSTIQCERFIAKVEMHYRNTKITSVDVSGAYSYNKTVQAHCQNNINKEIKCKLNLKFDNPNRDQTTSFHDILLVNEFAEDGSKIFIDSECTGRELIAAMYSSEGYIQTSQSFYDKRDSVGYDWNTTVIPRSYCVSPWNVTTIGEEVNLVVGPKQCVNAVLTAKFMKGIKINYQADVEIYGFDKLGNELQDDGLTARVRCLIKHDSIVDYKLLHGGTKALIKTTGVITHEALADVVVATSGCNVPSDINMDL